MKRYISLYIRLLSIHISLLFAYRANLFNEFVATSAWTCLVLSTMVIITQKAKVVAGWTQGELLLLTSGIIIIIGIFEIHFKRSFQVLPDTIYYGNLDNLLLKPVDSQFMVSFSSLKIMAFWRLLIGLFFLGYVLQNFHIQVTFLSSISFFLLLFFGLIVYYSVWFMAATLLIWFPRLSNIMELANSLNHTSRFPPEMYREFNIFIYFALLPYMFIVAVPVKTLLQKTNITEIIILLCCAGIFFIVSRFFWRYALRYYTSASN